MLEVQFYDSFALLSSEHGTRTVSFLAAPAYLPDGTAIDYQGFLADADVDQRFLVPSDVIPFVAEMLARADGREDVTADDFAVAEEALNLDLVVSENSPVVKHAAAALIGAGAVALFTPAGPVVMLIGAFGLVAIEAVGSAAWAGAEPEVEAFAGDVSAKLFNNLRKKWHIRRRRR